ncbi:MAG: replicative DNA helicase [Patescibacteria group bacterium]|nr:replicative DNA helicase [Patescibacteria group bacterium]
MPDGIKVPPQNIEAEQSVLGSVLLDQNAIIKVADILRSDDFYREDHATIYSCIIKLFEKRKPIDVVTLTNELEKDKKLKSIGGASYIATLVNSVPTAAHITTYANIVHQKATLRRLVTAAATITELGFDENSELETILDRAESTLFSVSQKYVKQYFTPIKDILADSFDRIDKLHKEKGAIRGVPTGFRDLDNVLAGLQKSDLVILAARPSVGKSAFALNIADHVACEHKQAVGIFSLEMSKEQIIDRLLCLRGSVDSWKLRTGNLEDEDFGKLNYAMGMLSETPIFIDDSPFLNVMEIRTKGRRLLMEQDLGLIVIDYLQLMSGMSTKGSDNRVQEVSEISRSLKALARELNVPILALSQLSRAVEHRPDKKPMLADLRESGCLTGDTLIFNAKTGICQPIEKLVGQKEFTVLTVDGQGKLLKEIANKVFSTGRKKVFELIFKSGRKIKATANHQFMTINGWERLDKLAGGDRLATPRRIDFKNIVTMSDEKIIVLAHLIGDGCYLKHQPLHYTNADPESISIVDRASQKAFGTKNRLVKQKTWFHLYLSAPAPLARGRRNPIVKWLDEELGIFDQRSGEKEIPELIFTLSQKQLALFVRHLFSTDGGLTFSSGIWRLHYASKSEKLIKSLQHLLLRFEIQSRIKINKKRGYLPVFDLVISGSENQLKFMEEIGIFGRKDKIVKKAIKDLRQIEPNTNVDIIPKDIWQKIVQKFTDLGWTTRQFHQEMQWAYSGTQRYNNGISRNRLSSIAQVLGDGVLSDLADSDIFWDEIAEIKEVGVESVYDITVPKNHNFIANDIVVHNSIEQDADVVMFIYRDEMYEQDSEKKNIAEILIRKHRHGPTGDVQLYWKPEYMKFATIEKKLKET